MDYPIIKYPRTPHLAGSRLQPGDEDLSQVPFSCLAGRRLTVEEKVDGANSAVSFGPEGQLLLQSRGHYLTGGWRERHYALFKTWAQAHQGALRAALGSRYVLYGEWLYAKHSVYYDALPDYFLEFDILDRETGEFLDTERRRELTAGLPLASAPVLAQGVFSSAEELVSLLGPSRYISPRHLERLRETCLQAGLDAERCLRETDASPLMEGLYIKIEEDGRVKERLKYVRASFAQAVDSSGSHWLDRPIVPNGLDRPLEELFLPAGARPQR